MAGLIPRLREELAELNEKVSRHQAVLSFSPARLETFVANQLYIVPNDLKALSVMLSRARTSDEVDFFKTLVDGDHKGNESLARLADELKLKFSYRRIASRGVTYTHYLSWLALHGTPGDEAVALTVNLPVWGANLMKIERWAKARGVRNTAFFELFAGPFDELEEQAETIAGRYADWERYLFVAKTIQGYELDFWDAVAGDLPP